LLFTKPKKCIGIDIGTHSIKAVQVSRSGGRLYVDEVGYALVDRNQVNADPINAHANAVKEALISLPIAQAMLVGALPGQTVVIRYPRLPETSRANLAEAVQKEAGQNIPYDLGEVSLDWTLLEESEDAGGAQKQIKVLIVAAKHEVIDSRVQITQAADIQLSILGVDSLALADAAEACDFLRVGETVALVNIGLGSASIHFVKDGRSNFIRDVNWGAKELIQAVSKERRCDFTEADRLLQDEANGVTAAEEEKERAPSPASLLDPLDDEGGASPPVFGGAPRTKPVRDIIGTPLARLVAEVRRSFDYYEHQPYERPVDRTTLSGRIAHLPVLSEVLSEELGVERVEVANPASSALTMGDDFAVAELQQRPAQFMVAIGLAARGMAEL